MEFRDALFNRRLEVKGQTDDSVAFVDVGCPRERHSRCSGYADGSNDPREVR